MKISKHPIRHMSYHLREISLLKPTSSPKRDSRPSPLHLEKLEKLAQRPDISCNPSYRGCLSSGGPSQGGLFVYCDAAADGTGRSSHTPDHKTHGHGREVYALHNGLKSTGMGCSWWNGDDPYAAVCACFERLSFILKITLCG